MLGQKPMKLRRKSGMSQQDVASALSVSRQTISNWESDASAPDISKAKDLAALYHISLDDLVSDEVTVTVAEEDERRDAGSTGGAPDLHVLESLAGATCRIAVTPGVLLPTHQGDVEVLEVDTDWARVTYKRAFKGQVTELVDMKSVVGFMIVSPANRDENSQKEVECNGSERMD